MPNTINADNGVISGITGIRTTADNTGNLALQSNGVTLLTATTANTLSVSNVATLSISGATSGAVTLAVPAVAGTNTVTIAAQTGTLNAAGPAFSASATGTQSFGSVAVQMQYNTKNFDTNTCYNNTASTTTLNGISVPAYSFAPNVAGYYQINWTLIISAVPAGGTQELFSLLYRNGSNWVWGSDFTTSSGHFNASSGAALVYLNGTSDYVGIYGNVNGGSNSNFNPNESLFPVRFSGCLVRGA